ncbi:MAG: sodium:alanine symporter family protein [Gemmatimonadetes bacterium]|uniref:Sodium:alanine symporter family protein n=1 Tax=Candidatus Kutchimonas denitrificans TaxID=3056748 RepID=A0AAE4ZBD9_9BACT|nr:sodium:alanine symporter family protein [Gemmatimonadota bacterium]NIR74365.1 sodium:alanine symporter family protein [Candidatus Kutchimonas denitrificans]NIS02616.1 sodium:alanine symporter family protein [Gemmatimonadota bacterium]NIT68491.1 sodium:alanine symporter family protein [Gemmatimonadota bacterium]NIU51968.1 amino acid carrier protein [Gemmatimonadota bacterium]
MDFLENIVNTLSAYIWDRGIPVGDQEIPWVVIALLGTGLFLTVRLGFLQLRELGHGFAVTSGIYDDPAEPGDVSHFQALTTALSATVGIGNIAGVALAIHWGGPGALFWMWITALVGMATKYSEVTLAQRYRDVEKDLDPYKWEGTVSGGPMYYIERGLGLAWRPLAIFFATLLGTTAFLTGNAIQANTVADTLNTTFSVPVWVSGLITATVVALVVIGGITRIGRVTGVLAPTMAAIYVLGALTIILMNADRVIPTFGLIFREAFNPTASVAGSGTGIFLLTMMWGVKRGLFSNEAGQGSAPIAHAAAKTDEPVSEGVVALLEPFIDTIVICTMTGLVIIMTGVWNATIPTEITLDRGDISYMVGRAEGGYRDLETETEIRIEAGRYVESGAGAARLAWHEVPVEALYLDAEQTQPFDGVIDTEGDIAIAVDGTRITSLYGNAVESGAPLTMLAFQRGLPGEWGKFIVVLSVFLFAISTAIAWSYYGDRCANYLFGHQAVLPYKFAFVTMHFVGAILTLAVVWTLGDVFLGIVILPNLLALLLLSGKVALETKSYFARKPWIENREVHRRLREERRRRRAER